MESISARTPSKQQQQQQSARGSALSVKSVNTRTAAALNALKTPDKQLQQQQSSRTRQQQVIQAERAASTTVVSGSTRKKRAAAASTIVDEESAVITNGRALMAATTTQLGAPAEISSKRRKLEEHHQQAQTIDLTTPKKQQQQSTTNTHTRRSRRTATTAGQSRAENTRERDTTESRRAAQERENKLWKAKYTKAFKGFVFYFDGIEQGTKRQIERALKQLDSAVEPFFSKEVTHVLTTRPIPPHLLQPLKPASQTQSQSTSTSIFAQSISTTSLNNTANNTRRGKSSSVSPSKHALSVSGKQQQQQESLVGPSRRSRTRNAVNAANGSVLAVKTPPKIKAFADVGALDSQDILHKAHSFGMKLWTLEKLHKMVARLLDCPSPPYTHGMSWNFNSISTNISNAGSVFALQMATGSHNHHHHHHHHQYQPHQLGATARGEQASLPNLLRAEALTGSTYERDLNTLRPDYTYFSSKTGYLLVEDSSQEYQPAHTKVYESRLSSYNEMCSALEKDPKGRETGVLVNSMDWPILFGGQEGRTAFSRPANGYTPPLPNLDLIYQTSAQANKENNSGGGKSKKGKLPAAATLGTANTLSVSAPPNLRRSASMNALNNAALNANNGTAGVTTRLRSKQQASISINTLDSQAFQAASGNSQIISSNLASATSTTTTRSGQIIGGCGSQSLNNGRNSLANGIIVDKRLARLGSKAGKHIVTLGSANNNNSNGSSTSSSIAASTKPAANVAHALAGPPTVMKRSLSLDAGLNRLKPIRPPREEVKKPGYCENCRVRYDDFKAHTKSKKHRRFALDPNNWTELDELISDHIQRPILPELLELYHNAETEVPSDIEASDDSDSEMDGDEEEEEEEEEDQEDDNEDGLDSDSDDDFKAISEAQLHRCDYKPAITFFHSKVFLDHLKRELIQTEEVRGEVMDAEHNPLPGRIESALKCIERHVRENTKPIAGQGQGHGHGGCSQICVIAIRFAYEFVRVNKKMNKMNKLYKRWEKGDPTALEEATRIFSDSGSDEDEDEETDSEEEDAMQDDSDDEDEDDEEDEDAF